MIGTTPRQFCLDIIKVSWVGGNGLMQSDCAILLEIEPSGGLVQANVAIAMGSEITLGWENGSALGQVTSCEEDSFGYVVNFVVDDKASNWFPEYVPSYLHSTSNR